MDIPQKLPAKEETFGSGVALQYAAVASMFLSSTIFYFLIAHLLSTTLVGSISLLYALMNIAGVAFVLGFSQGLEHFISYHVSRGNYSNIKAMIRRIGIFAIISSVAAMAIIYFISPFIAITLFHSYFYVGFIRIIGIAISAFIFRDLFSSIILGLKRYRTYSISYIFVNIFTYFFPILLLLYSGKAIYVIIGIAVAGLVNAVIFIVMVSRIYLHLEIALKPEAVDPFKTLFIYSFPLFFASIMTTSANYLDRIVVSYFLNLSYIGIYNFALVISSAATVFIMPISNMLIPRLSSYFSLDDIGSFKKSIRMLLNIASLIYIPVAMGIAAMSRITLYNFAGKNYTIAYIPIIIIMFATSLFVGSVILASGIKSVRKTRIFLLSSGLALLTNLIFSIVLIPRFSIIGASIAYSSMTVVNFIVIYIYAKKFNISNYDMKTIGKIWASSLIIFSALFYLQSIFSYNIPLEILYVLLGLTIYMLELKLFRIIKPDERDFLLTIIPEKFKKMRNMLKYISS
jgi:O-antigen/teichoic acid export membrane protein